MMKAAISYKCLIKPRIPTIGGTVLFRTALVKESNMSKHSKVCVLRRGTAKEICHDCPERIMEADENGISYECLVTDCEAYAALVNEYERD